MRLVSILEKLFFSYKFILISLFILGASAGVATFIESAYDTQTAKILVYDALWYEVVMCSLTISLVGVMYKRKMWKKQGAFIVHLAFIIILIGAGLTRYSGYEGIMHIREGLSENKMMTVKPYFQIKTDKNLFEYPLVLGQIGDNDFVYKEIIAGKELRVSYNDYRPGAKGDVSILRVDVTYDNQTQRVSIEGGAGWIELPTLVTFGDVEMELLWGSKLMELPFELKLVDFQLERYAGSMSPSSYASEMEVITTKEQKNMPYRIFMNHPLTYEGFKFFQSSYDKDEQGTVLEVNKDPGKWPTYIGYFLLCLGFIANFFTQGSRFFKLRTFLQKSSFAIFLPLLLCASTVLKADQSAYLEQFRKNSQEHTDKFFSELLVQDYMGRIKPISTEALELVNKITNKSSIYGLSAEQVILGMVTNPKQWQEIKIIKISNENIIKALNLPRTTEYVSFSDIFDEEGYYKLAQQINVANQKSQSRRTTFDNDVIKFDEKLNIVYLTFKGIFFKFIPIPNDKKWLDPNEAFANDLIGSDTKKLLNQYLAGLAEGIDQNQWTNANSALAALKESQRQISTIDLPSQTRVKAEVIYNHLSLFQKLISIYLILGLVALVSAMVFIFVGKNNRLIERVLFYAFVSSFLVHTLGLALRWYISGHAPWSDSYESLIYIGWSASLAGVVLFRKSLLALCASSLLAGIVMLVAHMSFINPQITNLVPVLKSYWLTIHVSIITASYGFLGLGALLGFLTLLLMIMKKRSNKERINTQIRHLVAINEISLIIGISMLTIGNFLGGVWANESWGRYWGWDPKETWSFVSIIVYALILHLRFIKKLDSVFVFSIASFMGFATIIMTYFGVNYYLAGKHSYAASGAQASIPDFVYYTLFVAIGICILAYRGRDVKTI